MINTNSHVLINNQEEYDIAVRAFVKAGFDEPFKDLCSYKRSTRCVAASLEGTLFSFMDCNLPPSSQELTIPQLREYLNDGVYEVGDVVYAWGCFAKIEIVCYQSETIATKHIEVGTIKFSEVDEHYKLQERK